MAERLSKRALRRKAAKGDAFAKTVLARRADHSTPLPPELVATWKKTFKVTTYDPLYVELRKYLDFDFTWTVTQCSAHFGTTPETATGLRSAAYFDNVRIGLGKRPSDRVRGRYRYGDGYVNSNSYSHNCEIESIWYDQPVAGAQPVQVFYSQWLSAHYDRDKGRLEEGLGIFKPDGVVPILFVPKAAIPFCKRDTLQNGGYTDAHPYRPNAMQFEPIDAPSWMK